MSRWLVASEREESIITELKPWHQQPNETRQAFAAFKVYRNLDPSERSLSRVASELAKSKTLISRWSFTWNWVERAEAWDHEEDRILRLSRIEAKKKMDEDHLKIARTARNKAVQRLKDFDPAGLTPQELRYWLDLSMTWERRIIGEPETIQEHRTKVEVADYDLEKEMAELQPIIDEMYRKGILTDDVTEADEPDAS